MPFVKGSNHSEQAREKMRAAKQGKPHSAERKAKISAANRGKVRDRKYQRICPCGAEFKAGVPNAAFCSTRCKRASYGHGLRHAPEYRQYLQCCAICESTKNLVGDHDHSNGEPRGILCRNCNLAIGNLRDSPALLRAAADYLERSSKPPRPGIRVYLAGPMSNLPDLNFPAFNAAAAKLRAVGYEVVNPAEINVDPAKGWIACMEADIPELLTCQAIVMLPGWEKSKGARLEHHIASELGRRVIFYTASEANSPTPIAAHRQCQRMPSTADEARRSSPT